MPVCFKRKIFLFLLVAWCAAQTTLAQSPPGAILTLDEAVRQALEINPAFQAQKAEVEAKKASIGVERSLEDPMVGVEFEGVPISTSDLSQAMERHFIFSQKIPFPSKLVTRGTVATKEFEAQKNTFNAFKLQTIRETEHAYHELYLTEQKIEVNKELQGLWVRLSKSEQARFESEPESATAFLKSQIELERLQSETALLSARRLEALARLNTLRHRDPSEEIRLATLSDIVRPIFSYQELEKIILKEHPEIKMAALNEEAARAKVSLDRQENVLPDFQAKFSYDQMQLQEDAFSLELMINVPFLWGKHRSELKESLAQRKKAGQELVAARDARLKELREIFSRFESAAKIHNIFKGQVVPHASMALQSASSAYAAGRGDFLMLIDSAREYKKAKLEAIEALVEYHKAFSDLKYATGGIL